jgi:hypothetical protein
MRVLERYSAAVNSDNLTVDERTTLSDTDVLGGAGLAAKSEPLGIAIVRLLADGKPGPAIAILAEMVFKRARTLRVKFSQVQADDLSRAVLGWYRHGTCWPCGGTGFQTIPDTPVQGDECPHCKGSGKLNFDRMFDRELCPDCCGVGVEFAQEQDANGKSRRIAYVCAGCDGSGARFLSGQRANEQLELARWLSGEIDRSQTVAGRIAMALIAPRLEL